jgi:hypothetical protein
MTGCGAGFCGGANAPGFVKRMMCGLGGGGRGRHGWRNRFYATGLTGWVRAGSVAHSPPASSPAVEKQTLQDQVETLQSQLDAVKARLAEFQASDAQQ